MDAPFFLYGGLALATGRGEHVFPLADAAELPLVLLIPEFGVSRPRRPIAVCRNRRLLLAERTGPNGPIVWYGFSRRVPRGPNSVASSSRAASRTTSNGPPCCKRPGLPTPFRGCGAPWRPPEPWRRPCREAVRRCSASLPARKQAARAAARLSEANLRAIATRTITRSEHRAALLGELAGWGVAEGIGAGFWFRSTRVRILPPQPAASGDRSVILPTRAVPAGASAPRPPARSR